MGDKLNRKKWPVRNRTKYAYDGYKRRVKKTTGSQTSYSFYSSTGTLMYKKVGGIQSDYLYAGSLLVAKKTGSTVDYVYTDLLGSPMAGNNGAAYKEHYRPYGDKKDHPIQLADDVGYTGHQDDVATGLTYMQARYYDPIVGRFMAVDPVGFTATNPKSFGRYTYANDNPYKYNDPDGRAAGLVNKTWEKVKGVATVGPFDAYQVAVGKHRDFAVSVSNQFASAHGKGMTKAQVERLKNGVRHVAWQASITMEEGLESAQEIARLHELGETSSKDSQIDQHNNVIGQSIGQNAKDLTDVVNQITKELQAGTIITSWKDPRVDQTAPNYVGGDSSYAGSGSQSSGSSDSSTSSCSSGSYPKC